MLIETDQNFFLYALIDWFDNSHFAQIAEKMFDSVHTIKAPEYWVWISLLDSSSVLLTAGFNSVLKYHNFILSLK